MGRVDAAGDEAEERLRDLAELGRLGQLQELLQLVEEHDLLLAVGVRPVLDQPAQDLRRKRDPTL